MLSRQGRPWTAQEVTGEGAGARMQFGILGGGMRKAIDKVAEKNIERMN